MKVGTKVFETVSAQKIAELLSASVAQDLGLDGQYQASLRFNTAEGKLASIDVILEYRGPKLEPTAEPESAPDTGATAGS